MWTSTTTTTAARMASRPTVRRDPTRVMSLAGGLLTSTQNRLTCAAAWGVGAPYQPITPIVPLHRQCTGNCNREAEGGGGGGGALTQLPTPIVSLHRQRIGNCKIFCTAHVPPHTFALCPPSAGASYIIAVVAAIIAIIFAFESKLRPAKVLIQSRPMCAITIR